MTQQPTMRALLQREIAQTFLFPKCFYLYI